MAKVKFELNREGVSELLRSQEVLDLCTEYANNALARLGDGYEVNTMVGAVRANAEVYAQSFAAKRENLKSNTILKAVFGK
jgi:hypothetical protein